MGEKDNKISTIVLKVDLECQRCYKKIRRALCKIQDKMDIKTISFDEKSNSVTISGPFDAEKVCRKLCCQAGRVIKDMNIKGKESKDGGEKAKPAEKDAGKAEKPKEGKADKEAGKAEKDGKADKKEAKGDKEAKPDKEKAKDDKEAKPDKEKAKDDKAEKKKVKFADDDVKPAADAKPKAIPQADLGPLLEKIMAAKAGAEPPHGEPVKPAMAPAAAQGVAVPSIWPAPAGSVSGYSYNPSYDPSYYGGYGGCGCGYGYASGYCRCSKPAAPGGYYGVPVYDNQGWYYGGRQPYYAQQQQQQCCEDPNAGCSVM